MREYYEKNKENINKVLHFLVFLILIFVFFKFLAKYFAPFIFGYIIALMLYPLARLLQNKFKVSKGISAALAILILLLIIGSVGALVVSKIVYEARIFYQDTPNFIQAIINEFEELQGFFQDRINLLPQWLKTQINNNFKNIISLLTSFLSNGKSSTPVGIVKGISTTIMVLIFGFISSFFIIKDKPEIDSFIFRQFPKSIQTRARVVKIGLVGAISGYVRAQLIMMLITGSICAVSLAILGSPYALFLALIIAFVDALPVFGSGAIFWPWALFCALNGNYKRAIFLIIINLTVLLTRQITEPRVLGNQIGVNPLVTLTSIYFGLKVFGFLGIIIGPMFVLVVKAMQEADLLPKWK